MTSTTEGPTGSVRAGIRTARVVATVRNRVQRARRIVGRTVGSTVGHLTEPAPAWSEPPTRRPARPEVRVATGVSARLAEGLALEVTTVDLRPGWWPTVADADVVLVEVRDGAPAVPDVAVPDSAVPSVAAPTDVAVPLVLWATSGAPSEEVAPLAAAATAVFVADPEQLVRWRVVAPSAELLLPAASTRQQPLPEPRDGIAMLVDGLVPAGLMGTTATVVAKGLSALQERVTVHQHDERAPLPRVLAEAAVAADERSTRKGVASAAVVVDGTRGSTHDTWTLLAAAAAQTAVVTPSGWSLPAGMQVPGAADAASFRSAVVARLEQPELRDREARRLHRALVAGHGLDRRIAGILGAVGLPSPPVDTSVSAVVPTRRPHEIANVLANLGRQSHRDTELVLVLHGLDLDEAELQSRADEAGVPRLTLVRADPALTLGACMNLGVDAAAGAWVAKMDDDNYYGTHYLTDLVAAAGTSAAGIVGKWAHYVWLRSSDTVVLRHADTEHRYARRIQGGSMLFAGDVVRTLRFSDIPRAVDSDILDRAIAEDVKIWSADRFNFVSVRGDDRTSHTWTVADDVFLTAAGRLAFFGDPRTHVEV